MKSTIFKKIFVLLIIIIFIFTNVVCISIKNVQAASLSASNYEDGEYVGILQGYKDLLSQLGYYEVTIDNVVYQCDEYFEKSIHDWFDAWVEKGGPFYVKYTMQNGKVHYMVYLRPVGTTSQETSSSWSTSSSLDEEQALINKSMNDFQSAFEEFLEKTGEVLDKKADSSSDTNQKSVETMANELQKIGAVFTFQEDWPKSWSKDEVYQAFAQEIVTIANQTSDMSKITDTDPNSFASSITNSVIKSYKFIRKKVDSKDNKIKYELSIHGIYGSFSGQITCSEKKSNKSYIIMVSMDEASTRKVLKAYTEDLAALTQNTANMIYATLAKELFGASITDLTTNFINTKLVKYEQKLIQAGLGGVISFCREGYTFYNYIPKLSISNKDPLSALNDVKTILNSLEADSASLEKGISKKAAKKVIKIGRTLVEDLETYIYTGKKPEGGIKGLIKNIFTCPVNVSVYNSSGNQIGYVGEDDIWYNDSIFIEEKGGAKIVYALTEQKLSFKLSATDYGLLSYSLEGFDSEGNSLGRTNFYDNLLTPGLSMAITTAAQYTDNADNDVNFSIDGNRVTPSETIRANKYSDKYVEISASVDGEGGSVAGNGKYLVGSAVNLMAVENEGYIFLGWFDKSGTLVSVERNYEFTARSSISVIARFVDYVNYKGGKCISSGSCGPDAKYAFYDNGMLLITGSGEICGECADISNKRAPWYGYRDRIKKLRIEDSITTIDKYAFYKCTNLTSVTLGNSVTEIKDWAFSYCPISEIYVDDENATFASDNNILYSKDYTTLYRYPHDGKETISVRDGVKTIGRDAFGNITTVKKIILPQSVTNFDECAFSDCSGLTSITLPNSVISIGDHAFEHCSSLTSITIPDSVTSIGTYAFDGCIGLKSAGPIGSGCNYEFGWKESIPAYAFDGCSGLTSITVPDSVTSIDNDVFQGFSSLTSITIPDSVISIGASAFHGCSGLKSAGPIGSGCNYEFGWKESIPTNAFRNCSSLTSITIPDSVTSIGDYAFDGCSSLTSIKIPDSVTSISKYAFDGCSSLTSITIPDSVTSIGNYAFYYCSSLTSITIPNSLTSIGDYAFENCSSLTSITIPNSVTSIGSSTFSGCSSLTSITIPNSVTVISQSAFEGCNVLTDVYYSGSKEEWAKIYIASNNVLTNATIHYGNTCGDNLTWSFDEETDVLTISGSGDMRNYIYPLSVPWDIYRTNITSVEFNGEITSISKYAFYDCSKLTSITIPDSVTSIGDSAFEDCSGLTSITIPDSVTSIGNYAFYYCSSLTSITIPNSLTSIGDYAFEDCRSLTSITIPDSVTSIGSRVFEGCSSLTSINVSSENKYYASKYGVLFNKNFSILICCPEGKIGDYIIPDSVTSISEHAFHDCSKLTSITIPDSVTSIGEYAFAYCYRLTDVYYFGSEEDWAKISIASNNEYLTNTTIHYNTCGDNLTYSLDEETGVLTICGDGDMYDWESETDVPWYSIRTKIKSVEFNGEITSIGAGAFNGCSSLTSITIPDSVTSIGHSAFNGCSSLRSITIPDLVTSIGADTFRWCDSLTSITIPYSVASIGTSAFNGCFSLTDVYYSGSEEDWDRISIGSNNSSVTNATIHYSIIGQCGDNLTYTLYDNGLLLISGYGDMWDFDMASDIVPPWFIKLVTSIELSENITHIGDYAFIFCQEVTEITIPASVESIGKLVFAGCSQLTEINVDEKNKNYTSSDGVLFNKGMTTLICCPSAKSGSYDIPSTVKIIDEAAFIMSKITDITIPDSLASIGASAFDGCDKLTDVYYSGSEEDWAEISIGNYNECLTNATIHYSIIGQCGDNLTWSFDENTGVLTISGSGDMWNGYYDDNYDDYLELIKDVEFVGDITSISDAAFIGCSNLTSIKIPDTVTSIGVQAFERCSSLTSITIPASVTSIGVLAFWCCDSLTSINVDENNKNYSSEDGVLFNKDKTAIVAFPGGKSGSYIIPDTVTSVGFYGAFDECHKLTEVTIPASVVCFVEDIYEGSNAFAHCDNLKSITVDESNPKYTSEDGVLYNKDKTTLMCLPYKKTGAYVMPDSVTKISQYNFGDMWDSTDTYTYGCSISSFTFGKGFSGNTSFIFAGCDSLKEVVISESMTSIGESAFADCSSLTSVTIPDSVTSIYDGAFDECENLTDVYYTGSKEDWSKIDISDYNEELLNANIHYNYVPNADTTTVPVKLNLVGAVSSDNSANISFKSADGTTVSGEISEGKAEIAIVEGETYTVTISKPGFTSYTVKNFVAGQDELSDNIEMYAGDVNGDNIINAKDRAIMSAAFGTRKSDDDFSDVSDFNGDNIINAKDVAVLSSNFTKRGIVE